MKKSPNPCKKKSSTQTRSHAQKLFYKINNNNILNFDKHFNKYSIKSLHKFANTIDENQYATILNTLNMSASEKKILNQLKQTILRKILTLMNIQSI